MTDSVRPVPLPATSGIASWYDRADLADAFAVSLDAAGTGRSLDDLARAVLADPAPWFRLLMTARDRLVAGFGIRTSAQLRAAAIRDGADHIDFFRVLTRTDQELILGEDDRHLDFRLSLLRRPRATGNGSELVATTAVRCHGRLGRSYLALISPFHRLVVIGNLGRAARSGWRVPAAAG